MCGTRSHTGRPHFAARIASYSTVALKIARRAIRLCGHRQPDAADDQTTNPAALKPIVTGEDAHIVTLGEVQQAPPGAGPHHQRADEFWCSTRRGSGQWHDQVALVACWCARAIVESTDTDQSIIPAASAAANRRSSTRSQVPWRSHPPMPGPQRLPRPEHGGNITPCDPAPIPVDDPLHNHPSIRERPTPTTRAPRQQPLDQRPLGIRQHLKTQHSPSTPATPQTICQTRTSRAPRDSGSRDAWPSARAPKRRRTPEGSPTPRSS